MKKEETTLERLNYLLQIMALLSCIAIILIYSIFEIFSFTHPAFSFIKSVFTDIFAVLFAYLVISFVLGKKGVSPSQIFQKEVSEDILRHLPSNREFLTEDEANAQFDLDVQLYKSKELSLVAYSFISLIDRYRREFVDVVKTGTKIKILILEPFSDASSLLLKNQKQGYNVENDLLRVISIVQGMHDDIKNLDKVDSGSFEVRFMNWLPSYSVMISNPHQSNGIIRLLLYPINVKLYHPKHSIFKIIKRENEKMTFDGIVQHFEELWATAKTEIEVLRKLELKN